MGFPAQYYQKSPGAQSPQRTAALGPAVGPPAAPAEAPGPHLSRPGGFRPARLGLTAPSAPWAPERLLSTRAGAVSGLLVLSPLWPKHLWTPPSWDHRPPELPRSSSCSPVSARGACCRSGVQSEPSSQSLGVVSGTGDFMTPPRSCCANHPAEKRASVVLPKPPGSAGPLAPLAPPLACPAHRPRPVTGPALRPRPVAGPAHGGTQAPPPPPSSLRLLCWRGVPLRGAGSLLSSAGRKV